MAVAAVALGGLVATTLAIIPFWTAIALASAAAVALAALREPFAGLLALAVIITVLPFAVLPLRIVFAPSFVDVALTATLGAVALRSLRRHEPLVASPVSPLVLIFVGMALTCFVLGAGQADVSGDTTRLFFKLLNSVLLFFGVLQVVRTERELMRTSQTLMVGTAAAGAIAVLLYALPQETTIAALSSLSVVGYPTGPDVLRPIAETTILRATGTAIDPNVLGGTLMIGVGLVAAQALAPAPRLPRLLLVAMAVVMLIALGLTYSRSAWVGAAAALAFLATVRERRLLLLVPVAALAIAALPPGQAALERLSSGFAARDPAAAMRLDEYRNALAIIHRYPWFGVGFGLAPTLDLTVGVSSLFLTIGEQMGLIGLGLFLTILGIAIARAFRARLDRDTPLWGLTAGLQAAMLAALTAGFFDHYFFNMRFPHMAALFWMLLALLVAATRLAKEPSPPAAPDAGAELR
jgi:O-antigen ligase